MCLMEAASTSGCDYMVRGMMPAGHARRSMLMACDPQLYSRLQDAGASQSVLAARQVGGERFLQNRGCCHGPVQYKPLAFQAAPKRLFD